MNKKLLLFQLLILAGGIFLSACGSLISQVERAVQEDYGSTRTPTERQTRSFEKLWDDLTDNYIYYDSADVDWSSIHDDYLSQIEAGLTDDQYIELMNKLQSEVPDGALTYQSRGERIELDTEDTASYEGIGAIVGFRAEDLPHVIILDVIAGSPAEKAGIKPHDSIYAIDGNPVLLEEGLSVVNRIRGPAGSQVTLQIKTPGQGERDIKVTRGKLTSSGKITANQVIGTNYGYILLPPINYNTMTQDIINALEDFSKDQQFNGLILDLRIANSSGGFPLENLLALFHNGEIGEFYSNTQTSDPIKISGQDKFNSQKVPLVILVGRNTKGYSEIFAASLQTGQRAILIGESTPGNVETVSAFLLPDGSRIITETASFRLPNRDEIGTTGITPDLMVDAGWDDVLPGNDSVLDQAIKALDEQQ